MPKKTLKCTALLCILVGLSIMIGIPFITFANENTVDVVIYHTNDLHGNAESVWSDGMLSRIGFDMIKSAKYNTPNSILIDAGDATWGTQVSKYNKGLDIVKLMNAAGYDGMILGNHEFDYGVDSALECAKIANFPVVSANTYRNGKLLLNGVNGNNGRNFIIEISGKRIGFFGVTTEETNRTTIPSNLEGIVFKNEIDITREEVKYLKEQGVDLTVGIMHVGVDTSSKITSRDIAKKVPGIDIIIDGHSHTEIIDKENNVLITQTGIGAANLGKIDIRFADNKPQINAALISSSDLGRIFIPDNDITKMYDDIYNKISPSLEKVVGKIENNLYGGTYNGTNISRLTETNMGDIICDSMMYKGKQILKDSDIKDLPIVAFENGGAIRSKINSGFIRMEDIFNVFPLDNRLSVQVITPKTLYQVLERGVGKLTMPQSPDTPFTSPFGGFPQISGMKIEIDPALCAYDYDKNTGGKRVTGITLIDENGISGNQLRREDDVTKIIFLFNDYALYEYPAISDTEVKIKGDYLYNIFSEYVSKKTFDNGGKFSYPVSQNRVIVKNKFVNRPGYDSEVYLKDSTGILSSVAVSVNIDGNWEGTLISDENAKIKITNLGSGPHVVKVYYGDLNGEIYINNEIGMKNNSIEFIDKTEEDIYNVSNIIGQIPYYVNLESSNLIKFARSSYNNLNDLQHTKIINYNKLKNAEEKLKILEGNYENNDILPKIYGDKTLITIISFCVFISGIGIIWALKKRKRS